MQRFPLANAPQDLTCKYPSWDDLCSTFNNPYRFPELVKDLDFIKANPPGLRFQIARLMVSFFLRDEVYQKFLKCSWAEIIDMVADQVVRNRQLTHESHSDDMKSHSQPLTTRTHGRFFRPYGQMPCTRDTVKRRVAKARQLVPKDAPILLLGDDDLVSVELARQGFTKITAIDIDPVVLREIEQTCKEDGLNIRLRKHDLALPPPTDLIDEYRLVLFDPEYSIRGVELFLNAGLQFTQHREDTLYFISIHLMSLMRKGLDDLQLCFSRNDLELAEFAQGFNAYPAPSRLKSLIHLVNQLLIGSKTLSTEGYSFPFLLSDALILRKLRKLKEPRESS